MIIAFRLHLSRRCLRTVSLLIAWGLMNVASAEPLLFAAASLTDVINAVVDSYQQQGGGAIRVSYAGTGTLARQIEHGAPADMFVSADPQWIDYLRERGRIHGQPYVLASNELVLIAPANDAMTLHIERRMDLASKLGAGRLAIGDPATVPAGKYARAALEQLEVWDTVKDRLLPSESVRATLAIVSTREAPLGIVYATDVRGVNKVQVLDAFDASTHPPIVYLAIMIPDSPNEETIRFWTFLQSVTVTGIFRKQGFVVNR